MPTYPKKKAACYADGGRPGIVENAVKQLKKLNPFSSSEEPPKEQPKPEKSGGLLGEAEKGAKAQAGARRKIMDYND